MTPDMTKAIAYLRTSSATNVGGDSDVRQRAAIEAYAKANGMDIVAEYYDAAVSGRDPIETRKGFAEMLDRIEGNGVRLVLVEDASRFARELMVQELGIVALIKRGVRLVTASGEELTDTTDPMRKMFRQITGAFHEYEKARMVAKLRGARERKATQIGRSVEGQKGYAGKRPEVIEAIRAIRAEAPEATLQDISDRLAALGHVTQRGQAAGKPLDPARIHRLCKAHGIEKGTAAAA